MFQKGSDTPLRSSIVPVLRLRSFPRHVLIGATLKRFRMQHFANFTTKRADTAPKYASRLIRRSDEPVPAKTINRVNVSFVVRRRNPIRG